jgi:lipopolysaccharide/colanic/teichoic acid biosynthesis glycosyltransferase
MPVQAIISATYTPSPWCNSRGKRATDVVLSSIVLVLATPAMAVVALLVRATSKGPALFRQERLGLKGRPFALLKFRTMHEAAPAAGIGVTRSGDVRITALGKILRASKLDELPQLINVLRGEMSLVGPRPDLERFWSQSDGWQREVLALRPGITGAASLVFRNEEKFLLGVPLDKVDKFYIAHLLTHKAEIDLKYAAHASFWSDLRLMLATIFRIVGKGDRTVVEARSNEQISG